MREQETNDLLRLIDVHRFHNPLTPKACQLCKLERFRQLNTPTNRYARALKAVLRPPTFVLVMLAVIVIQTIAIGVLISG